MLQRDSIKGTDLLNCIPNQQCISYLECFYLADYCIVWIGKMKKPKLLLKKVYTMVLSPWIVIVQNSNH